MGVEIERRFIVNSFDWRKIADTGESFNQGYLLSNPKDWIVRVRIINGEKSLLTLKAFAKNFTNHEFEYEIPLKDAKSLMLLCKYKISKTRYKVRLDNWEWVVDCFHEQNSPLILAEIELNTESEIFSIPSWCKKEITGISMWSNASLAQNPISTWPTSKLKEQGLT